MFTVTFFIDTTLDYFSYWLDHYSNEGYIHPQTHQRGTIVLQLAPPLKKRNTSGYVQVRVLAYFVRPDKKGKLGARGLGDIGFAVIPLSPTRLEVKAECYYTPGLHCFVWVLNEIAKRWPETAEAIAEYVKQTSWGTPRNHPLVADEKSQEIRTIKGAETILHHIDRVHRDLGERLDNLRQGQAFIYQRVGTEARTILNAILQEVQEGRIEHSTLTRMLDATRRALKHMQNMSLSVNDKELEKSLADIYQAVNSNLTLHEKLELSLPIIPLLLEYKVELGTGVDLEEVWKELVRRAKPN
jgi:hypothetical protein